MNYSTKGVFYDHRALCHLSSHVLPKINPHKHFNEMVPSVTKVDLHKLDNCHCNPIVCSTCLVGLQNDLKVHSILLLRSQKFRSARFVSPVYTECEIVSRDQIRSNPICVSPVARHRDISTSRHLDIATSRHRDISTSRHLDIARHCDIATSRGTILSLSVNGP
jgi:hypothetical protein